MLTQIITILAMFISMLAVFFAYREGIKTGLSIKNGEVPRIIKNTTKSNIDEPAKKEQEELKIDDELLKDFNEAMDISRMYGGDN